MEIEATVETQAQIQIPVETTGATGDAAAHGTEMVPAVYGRTVADGTAVEEIIAAHVR